MNGMLTDLQNFDLYSLVDTIRKEVCTCHPASSHIPRIQIGDDTISVLAALLAWNFFHSPFQTTYCSVQVSITDMLGHTGLQSQDVINLLALRSQVRQHHRAANACQQIL